MPVQPWFKTQTSPDWKITLQTSDPNLPDLTGLTTAALSLIIVDAVTNVQTTGVGLFTQIVTVKNPAVVVYRSSASDAYVQNAKAYRIYVQVTFANGPDIFGPFAFTTSPL